MIKPSILSNNFDEISQIVSSLEGVTDIFHIDVIDGKFLDVTNNTKH